LVDGNLVANLHRIPSDGELEQRKLDEERKEENRKAAQDAATAKYRMEQAAPAILSALKALTDFLDKYPHQYAVDISGFVLGAQAAISKAEVKP